MTNPKHSGATESSFPLSRTATMDTVYLGKRRPHIPVLIEVDVTTAVATIDRLKKETGEVLSFTAWTAKCLAQAAGEHKRVQARRRGRRKLVLFDDVDIAMPVYRQVPGEDDGERVPMPFVIREANEKTVRQINEEIASARTARLADGQQWMDAEMTTPSPRLTRLFFRLPRWVRIRLFWSPLLRNPYRAKRLTGTVMLTSVATFGRSSGWAVPTSIHPLAVALGGVARKPGLTADRVEPRDFLSLTVLFDHDVVDGVPLALFLKRLVGLMESGYSLN